MSYNPKRPLDTERNQDATVYVGNLTPEVTESILYELMLQAAPVVFLKMPKDRVLNTYQGYGFVEFRTEKDVEYAERLMNGIQLFGRPIRVKRVIAENQKELDLGATLYIGNLDNLVDEKFLYETFKTFGKFAKPPVIVRDEETGASKGYGFLYFNNFDSSDHAMKEMNNQYLMNRQCKISYALKKDGKHGERHGDKVERLLAAKAQGINYNVANSFTTNGQFQQQQQLQQLQQAQQQQLQQLQQAQQQAQQQQQQLFKNGIGGDLNNQRETGNWVPTGASRQKGGNRVMGNRK